MLISQIFLAEFASTGGVGEVPSSGWEAHSSLPYLVAPRVEGDEFGRWRRAWGWGNAAVQTAAVLFRCSPYHCCAFGLVSSTFLMKHGAGVRTTDG